MTFYFDVLRNVAIIISSYYVFIPFASLLFSQFLGPVFFSKRKSLKKCGTWAVVTGSTDGIGRAYAEQLAGDGFNVVLISRSHEKLTDVSTYIETQYKVKTKVISVDFTQTDIYNTIKEQLKGLDIGVLVNNVGMSNPFPDYFEKENYDGLYGNMINCNVLSVVMMTRLILPGMVAKGKGGAIINVSSASGASPVPLLSVYSASKAFVDYFARAVNYEVSQHGIIVQSVMPFFVATKMSKVRRASFTIPSPKNYVNSALNLVGVEARTYGCFAHSLQAFLMSLAPSFLVDKLMFSTLNSVRRKALSKIQKAE